MMTRLLFTLVFLFSFSSFSFSQTYVQIGTGGESSSMPYTSWKYSWSKALYNSSDIGEAITINKIGFEADGSVTLTNQKIYLKVSTNTELTGTYEDTASSDYTLVYSGDVDVSSGWNAITLDQSFDYNGSDNLLVYWINEHGSSVSSVFKATTTSETVIKVKGGDSSFPQADGWNPYPNALPNIRFYYQSDGPANPANPQPADKSIKVDVDTSLTFDIGDNTTHYDLCFGLDKSNLDTIVNNQSVASAGTYTYNIDTLLSGDKTYYWQVIAINDNSGEKQESSIWKFTTQGTITEFPWNMSFEEVWTGVGGDTLSSIINTNYPDSTSWKWTELSWDLETKESLAHSGHYSIKCSNTSEGEFFVQTPRIVLPNNKRISYWWRTKSISKSNDTLFFSISTDGGNSWENLDTINTSESANEYVNELTDLSSYSGDNVYLRWTYSVSQTGSEYLYLDDITIEYNPSGPRIEVDQSSYTYNDLCVGGNIDYGLTIYNTGTEDLTISGATATGDYESNYTGTIKPGEKDTAAISFIPTATGTRNGEITFHSNAASGDSVITLSGNALEAKSTFFESFDASENLPADWNSVNSPDGYISGGGVDIVSYSSDYYSAPNAAKLLVSNDTVNPIMLITPGVKDYGINQLTYYAKKAGSNYDLDMQVGVMSNPYDASTFVAKQTISLDSEFRKDTITFKPTTSEPYIAFRHAGNPNGPDTWTSLRIDNISWETGTPQKPLPATVVSPADNETEVDILNSLSLKWNAGSGNADGYVLYLGTESNNWNIINQDTLDQSQNSYDITSQLDYATEYFWKVVPYNEQGDAENVKTWSFTTMADPVITSLPWKEDFEDAENGPGYNLPLGWSNQDVNGDHNTWDLWTDNPDAGAEYSHSGSQAMNMGLTLFSSKDDYLYTPPIELQSNKKYQLTFWWVTPTDPTTGQVYKERMKVFMGKENHDAAMETEIYSDSIETNVYKKDTIMFSPETDGRYHLGFYAWSEPAQYMLIVDDVQLVSYSVPEFSSEPDTLTDIGETYNYDIVCTDEAGNDLDITAEQLPVWLTLNDNGDGTASLSGTPSNTGEYSVKLKVDNGIANSMQEFTILVNTPPEFTTEPDTVETVNEQYIYNISCKTESWDDMVITANKPDWLTLTDHGDGTATLSGTGNTAGEYAITITADDGISQSTQEYTLTINTQPEFTSEPVKVISKSEEYQYKIQCHDADDDKLEVTADQIPDWLKLTDNGDGTATLSGSPNQKGEYDVKLIVSDGMDQNAQEFTILVNTAPEFTTSPDTIVSQQATYTYSLACKDDNGHDIQFTGDQLPEWLSLTDKGDGTATLEGKPSSAGEYTIKVIASDGYDQTIQEFTLLVNTAPEFTSTPDTLLGIDNEYTYTVSCTDADGHEVEIIAEELPDWLTLSTNKDGQTTLEGAVSQEGEYTVKLTADDGTDQTTQEFTISVSENVTGIDAVWSQEVNVYPNPTSGNFTINIDNKYVDNTTYVRIINLDGQLIENKRVIQSQTYFDLNDVQPGVYLIQIVSDKFQSTEKLIVK